MFLFTIASILLAALYYYLTRTFDYWRKRGVKHDKPIPYFGNNLKNFFLQASLVEMTTETYNKYPEEQLVGFFRGSIPELVIRDPEIAKCILKTDFNFFHRRGVVESSDLEVLRKHLAVVEDDLWRQLRLRTTPAFSSGKIKAMFPHIAKRVKSLQARLSTVVTDKRIDAKDLMARFTIDIISSFGFGVESDCLNNDNDEMRKLGIKIGTMSFKRVLNIKLKKLMPNTFAHVKIFEHVEKDVVGMVKTVMQQRNYEPIGRNDYVDQLLECKKKGAMEGDSIIEKNADGTPKKVSLEMDDNLMAAQCFLFFTAGFDTSSMASSYTLHELAHNPRAQEKAQEEIDIVLSRHNNELCYDAISEMTYLRWCLNEALRLFPPIAILARQSVYPYTFPGTRVTIDAGVKVFVPSGAYHKDPKIFPEPEQFRPERFDPDVMTSQQKLAYMPFGGGPRACIGERLGVLQAMAALVGVLSEYSVRPAPGAPRYPATHPASGGITKIKGGLPLIFHKRQ